MKSNYELEIEIKKQEIKINVIEIFLFLQALFNLSLLYLLIRGGII